MLGAIAADLAAWTYENDRERFYASLTSTTAVLSPLGKMAYDAAVWSLNRKEEDSISIPFKREYSPLGCAEELICCATLAWTNEHPEGSINTEHGLFYDDKQGMYAGKIITYLIRSLQQGKNKKEVLEEDFGATFRDLKSNWDWQHITEKEGLLIYLMRAWDCFEKAWDFTSSIHNAARWENVDRHLLCCLTGALAEAMYGCEYRLLKKHYADNWYSNIEYPADIAAGIHSINEAQFKDRVFFPKNSALTNVEKHQWSAYSSKFEGMKITSEQKTALLRAFYTGWEDRYGFYLDNGWIYTYRSGYLLAKFRIIPEGDSFSIVNLQHAEEPQVEADLAIEVALYSAYRFSK